MNRIPVHLGLALAAAVTLATWYFTFSGRDDLALLCELKTPKGAYVSAIAFRDSVAYLAAGYDGVRVLDISNPKEPKLLKVLPSKGNTLHVAVSGNCLCIADDTLKIADISIPRSPEIKARIPLPSRAFYVEPDWPLLRYYCESDDSARHLNISDLSNPRPWTEDDTREYFMQGQKGDTVFYADDEILRAVDHSHPSQERHIGELDVGGCGFGDKFGDLYLRTSSGNIQVIDVSNPTSMRVIMNFSELRELMPYQIISLGNHALVPTCGAGMLVLDVSNPVDIKRVSDTGEHIEPHHVGAIGNYVVGVHNQLAFVQESVDKLLIFDISKFAN